MVNNVLLRHFCALCCRLTSQTSRQYGSTGGHNYLSLSPRCSPVRLVILLVGSPTTVYPSWKVTAATLPAASGGTQGRISGPRTSRL